MSWWALNIVSVISLIGAQGCANTAGSGVACGEVGEPESCTCSDGASGSRVCLGTGELSACDCRVARTVPCSAPGDTFACACQDGRVGTEICLAGGAYTSCDCVDGAADGSSILPDGGGLEGADAAISPPVDSASCPAPTSCVEMMGVKFCADSSGLPPLCGGSADCSAAGFSNAQCVDPLGVGVTACVQMCE
jgi:hypothetical protein